MKTMTKTLMVACLALGAVACAPGAEAARDELTPLPAPPAIEAAAPAVDAAPESQPAPRATRAMDATTEGGER